MTISALRPIKISSRQYLYWLLNFFVLSLYFVSIKSSSQEIIFKFNLDAIFTVAAIALVVFPRIRATYLMALFVLLPLFFNPILWFSSSQVAYDSLRYNPFVFKATYCLYFAGIVTLALHTAKADFFRIFSEIAFRISIFACILFFLHFAVGSPFGVDQGYGIPRIQFFSNEPSTFAPLVLGGCFSNLFGIRKIRRALICFLAFVLTQSTSGFAGLLAAVTTISIAVAVNLLMKLLRINKASLNHRELVILFAFVIIGIAVIVLAPTYFPDAYNVVVLRLFSDLDHLASGEWMTGTDRLKQLGDWLTAIQQNFWFGWGAYSDVFLFPSEYSATVGTIFKFNLWGGIAGSIVLLLLIINLMRTATRYEFAFTIATSAAVFTASPGVQYDAVFIFILLLFLRDTLTKRWIMNNVEADSQTL